MIDRGIERRSSVALFAGLAAVFAALFANPASAHFLDGFDAFRAGDYCEAKEAWLKSEKSGDSSSAFGLGELYARGLCVTENQRLASRWYLTAALRGNSRARAEVGVRYAYGKGVEPNAFKAYVWLSAAKMSASGWDTDFAAKADTNRRMIAALLTPEERQRASVIMAQFSKKWALPREFNSLDSVESPKSPRQ